MRTVPIWIAKRDDDAIPPRVKDRVARKADDCCQACKRKIAASGNIVAERVPIQEAEFIILATSLHAELVAALFNLVEAVESAVDLDNHVRSFGTRVAAAHNVLQKAREK